MKTRGVLALLVAFGILFASILSRECAGREPAHERVPVRIGWQIPSATQGQIVEIFKRTDLLELHGMDPRLVPFSFGTPEVEAALEDKLDVVFAGDQPVMNLIARGGRWKIVSRLYYDRVAIMVPPRSPIRKIADLEGKTVASSFGSVAQREVIRQEEKAGLDPDKDVKNEDMDILEIVDRVRAGGIVAWGDIDAVAVWEPTASELELEGNARALGASRTLDVVAFSDAFVSRHPEAAARLLAGLVRAWHYFSANADRVRQWYSDDTQLGYTREALLAAARMDPNFSARSLDDVELSLDDEDMARLARAAAWAEEQGHVEDVIRLGDVVDRSLLAEAMKAVAADRFEKVKVILPSARESPMDGARSAYFLDRFPLWAVFVFMVLIVFLGIEAGQSLGRWRRRKGEHEAEAPVGTVVGAVLALLAFVIALTFSSAGNRFDARKQALLDEVNAIGTAYLRAKLIPEPYRTTTRTLLRDYVEARLGLYRDYGDPGTLRLVEARTAALQTSLWSGAEALAEADRSSEIYSLYTDSLNEVFDLNTTRIVLGAEYRIPFFVWAALGLVSALAMVAVGFQFGLGGHRSLTASLALGLTFALVILLILDLDRPGEGLIEVNQQPMVELYQSMSRPQE